MSGELHGALDRAIDAHTRVTEAVREESHRIAHARRLEADARAAEAQLAQPRGAQ